MYFIQIKLFARRNLKLDAHDSHNQLVSSSSELLMVCYRLWKAKDRFFFELSEFIQCASAHRQNLCGLLNESKAFAQQQQQP